MTKRWALFAVVVAVCLVAFAAYTRKGGGSRSVVPSTTADDQAAAPLLKSAGEMVYRYTGPDANYGQLAYLNAAATMSPSFISNLTCESVYVAGGKGICLSADRGVITTYAAKIFDAKTFVVTGALPLSGVPSRTRVSPNGELAAYTVFVSGHGYGDVGFSTQTAILATQGATVIADLEIDFAAIRDGQPFKKDDFNYWGVTFTPDSRGFYATLSTGGQHFLVRGDIDSRTAVVISEGVECPSLSPDGKRVAFKRRSERDGVVSWDLHVLDLASRRETPLAETRSVDDQLEWLGNEHVLYSVAAQGAASAATTDVWAAQVGGAEPPILLLHNAYSPSVVRQ